MDRGRSMSWIVGLLLMALMVCSSTTLSPSGINYEVVALMAIKIDLNDPYNVLESWDINSVDPCSWRMVTCTSDGFVSALLARGGFDISDSLTFIEATSSAGDPSPPSTSPTSPTTPSSRTSWIDLKSCKESRKSSLPWAGVCDCPHILTYLKWADVSIEGERARFNIFMELAVECFIRFYKQIRCLLQAFLIGASGALKKTQSQSRTNEDGSTRERIGRLSDQSQLQSKVEV